MNNGRAAFESSFPRTRESRFVEQTELAWIPAFAGTTGTRRSFVLQIIQLNLFHTSTGRPGTLEHLLLRCFVVRNSIAHPIQKRSCLMIEKSTTESGSSGLSVRPLSTALSMINLILSRSDKPLGFNEGTRRP